MNHRFWNAGLAGRAVKLCSVLAKYWRTRPALVDQVYRPELHYMRGPGPKWREAHARLREARPGELAHGVGTHTRGARCLGGPSVSPFRTKGPEPRRY